ncbi:MAG TPA: hypothetical protein ENF38_00755 [Candidatus Aenigmarchaeota archaeon]|nr:hypothetical protein [Candidatus Aenigmarchaeota archaeon]
MYRKIKVKIKGVTPLLMNKLNPEDLKAKTRSRLKQFNPEEEARKSAYIDVINGKRQLYIPSEAIFRAMINASGIYRTRKMSLKGILAGSIRIEPEKIPLGKDKYEIDIRPVRIQKDAVLRARAKVPNWEAEFFLIYDDELIKDSEILLRILKDAGKRFGLLDYRPQTGGPFGVFEVVEFKEIRKKAK